jgi:hypothetical protein
VSYQQTTSQARLTAGELRGLSGLARFLAVRHANLLVRIINQATSSDTEESAMTTQTAAASHSNRRSRRSQITAPALAGIAYAAAWVTGLAVWPSNLDVAASGAKVMSAYTGHQGVAMTQNLLVEGAAGIALAAVAVALARAAGRRGAGRAGRVVVLAGGTAAIVSLIQCALGLWLVGRAVPNGETARAGSLFHVINRMDGAKMLVLATMALAGAVVVRRTDLLPRWLRYNAALLAVSLTASGVGYLLLDNALAQAAAVSLPLLLIWVAATGVTLGQTSRQVGRCHARV